jgi:O-antigen ligase
MLYLVAFVFLLDVFRRHNGIDSAIKLLAFISLILAVACVAEYLSIVDFSTHEGILRVRWSKYAEMLITLSPLLWAAAIYCKRKGWFIFLAAVMSWLTAMLSLSKAAFLSGIFGFGLLFALVLLFSGKAFRKRGLLFASAWLTFTILVQLSFSVFSSVPATTNYVTGTAEASRSTSTMRVFTWKVTAGMIREQPFLGVGADNFGMRFNDGRAKYALDHPNDIDNATGEDFLFERAHNEYLQIISELGIIGFALFAAAFLLLAFWTARTMMKKWGNVSPMLIGAIAGMTAFGASSLFTSFSFRAAQNGLVFFALLAVAVYELLKTEKAEINTCILPHRPSNRLMIMLCLSATFCLAVFSATKACSYWFIYFGEQESDFASSSTLFENAIRLDPENGAAYFAYGGRSLRNGDTVRAAELFARTIENGIAASSIYSRLASIQSKIDDPDAAQKTLQKAISIYPRSIFLLTRYAVLLEDNGKPNEAEVQMEKARSYDLRQANGWYALIKQGGVRATYLAKDDPDIAPPNELVPMNAVAAYLNETFGEESTK